MRRTSQDISPTSNTDIADNDDGTQTAVPVGYPPAYQPVSRQQRQSRDLTTVASTASSPSAADIDTHQIVTSGVPEEYVDILQVQQLLLENAGGVSSDSSASVSVSGRGGVLSHRRAAVDSPRLRLEAAARSRMLLESYPPAVPTIPTPSHRYHHQPPPPPPPYYYANYMQQQQHHHHRHHHQYQSSSVEDLFALWLESSATGRSFVFNF